MPHRVLIVDDNEALAESLAEILRRRGYEADSVSDVQLARSRLDGVRVDLLILDVDVAGESGLKFLMALRQHGFSVPVVLITARPSEHVREEISPDVPVDVMEKPISVDGLLELMNQLLERYDRKTPVAQTSILLLSFETRGYLPLASPQERLQLSPVCERECLPSRQNKTHPRS